MARITLRQLLDHAAEHGYGVPAFNVNNMEQIEAIMKAANETGCPVIIQASRGARAYAGDLLLSKLIEGLEAQYPHLPICMHQDHGNSDATCASAIRIGFDSVMMDGSLKADGATPADYGYNVGITSKVVEMAYWVGVWSKASLAALAALRPAMAEGRRPRCRRQALEGAAVNRSGSGRRIRRGDEGGRAAVAIGTSHGAYKFTHKPTGDVLAMNVIEAIHKRIAEYDTS